MKIIISAKNVEFREVWRFVDRPVDLRICDFAYNRFLQRDFIWDKQ